jgi:hypothetical protein
MFVATIAASIAILTPAETLPPWFVEAFNDVTSGVAVSVGARLNQTQVESVSIITKHLPLGLFAAQKPDQTGIVFRPGSLNELCSFPTNAFTLFRKNIGLASNSSLTPRCGVSRELDAEWVCSETPAEYGAQFHGDLSKLSSTCHFAEKATMLEAEEALMRACIRNGDTKCGNTPWNEVVVAPYTIDAVGAIFWSHSGPFREPTKDDIHACHASSTLSLAVGQLPIIEFAGFEVSEFWPKNTLQYWTSNLTTGGYKVERHFRLQNASRFFEACSHASLQSIQMPSQSSPISFNEAMHERAVERAILV